MTSPVSTLAPVSRGSQEPTAKLVSVLCNGTVWGTMKSVSVLCKGTEFGGTVKSVSVLCNGMCGHSEISKYVV